MLIISSIFFWKISEIKQLYVHREKIKDVLFQKKNIFD